jgi:hypothetical protein
MSIYFRAAIKAARAAMGLVEKPAERNHTNN